MGRLEKYGTYGLLDEAWFDALVDQYVDNTYDIKRGTATITAGNTHVDVTHGLGETPEDVRITPLDDLDGRNFWVSDIGDTTFRINITSMDLQNHQFKWRVNK